MLIILKNKNTF